MDNKKDSVPNEIEIQGYSHVLYTPEIVSEVEMDRRAKLLYQQFKKRRSVRSFSKRKVNKSIIQSIIQTASTAPSGANKQPWKFCAISNPNLKSRIRKAAEVEEKENYERRMSAEWKDDLKKMGTDSTKPF